MKPHAGTDAHTFGHPGYATLSHVNLLREDSSCQAAPCKPADSVHTPSTNSNASLDTDNPFTEAYSLTEPTLSRSNSSERDDMSPPATSAFLGDEQPSTPSQPWSIPRALVRRHSQLLLQTEGSPLRWSYSSAHRERAADTFLATPRRLSTSSSLDVLTKAPTAPLPTPPLCSGNSLDSAQASAVVLRKPSSMKGRRLFPSSESGSIDPYMN